MKKLVSKFSIIMMLAFSFLIMPVMNIEAADGTMQITDGSAPVGEIATVTVTVEAGGAEIGDCEASLTYDTELLEFVEGTDTTLTQDGTILLAQYGTGTETMFTFDLQFRVLAEGSSTLTLADATAYLYSDETLTLQATGGTISSGLAVVGDPIDIDGMSYTFYENFTDAMVLDGFSTGTFDYDGYTHNVMTQDVSGKTVAYVVAEGGIDPVLAIYNENTAAFELTEIVYISTDAFLLLLKDSGAAELPEGFSETTLEMNGVVFPAWQNMTETEYYLVYALSSAGNEGFYQYDSVEGTYQRYTTDSVETESVESEETESDNTLMGKMKKLVSDNLVYCLGAVGIVILIMLIVIIIMSTILGRRNSELDDLYDELESKNDNKDSAKGNRNAKKAEKISEEYEDEEYEFGDDDFEDDDYEYDDDEGEYDDEDEYDDEEYEYDDEEYDYDDEMDEDLEDDFDDEDDYDFDDEEIVYEEKKDTKKKRSFKKKDKVSRETTEYSVDFIDL